MVTSSNIFRCTSWFSVSSLKATAGTIGRILFLTLFSVASLGLRFVTKSHGIVKCFSILFVASLGFRFCH